MRFGSLFTGIGGFDLGLERAGMTCAWQVEIDKSCQKVLARHWPDTERMTDVKEVGKHNLDTVDVICGGFPCQDLSVAGRRAGLAGERSGLWFEFYRILAELRPQWVVIENVPGLLSSNGGRDFAVVLRGLVELGYGVCWRVLDAQYFGVAQRRRRVFVVGYLGDGRATEVLFEREGSAWDTPPSRAKGQRIAPTLSGSTNRTGGDRPPGTQVETAESLVPALRASGVGTERAWDSRGQDPLIAMAVNAHPSRRYDAESETFIAELAPTLSKESYKPQKASSGQQIDFCIVQPYTIQQNDGGNHKRKDRPEGGMYVKEADAVLTIGSTDQTVIYTDNIAPTLASSGSTTSEGQMSGQLGAGLTAYSNGVRRLTPTECERLQGFPDGWTAGQADGPRYRQLGNAVAVPVIEWIGRRIMEASQ